MINALDLKQEIGKMSNCYERRDVMQGTGENYLHAQLRQRQEN